MQKVPSESDACRAEVGMISPSTHWLLVLNLVNGVMGVSALVLPSCFHRCGILLGCVLLLTTNFFTKISCSFLVLAANLAHRDTYEGLGLQAYGQVGKSCVEAVTALYVFGNLIAFFVVVADILPGLLKVFIETNMAPLGPLSAVVIASCVMLPLSLSRSIRTVCKFSLAAMVCYVLLVLRLFVLCKSRLLSDQPLQELRFWRFSGFYSCLPIFALSLSCQTQIFVISREVPHSNSAVMNGIVNNAVDTASVIYFSVAMLGYITFQDKVNADVFVSMDNQPTTWLLKLTFLISVALSFPILIVPCRRTIYHVTSYFLQPRSDGYGSSTGSIIIPSGYWELITVVIIGFSLLVSLVFPYIEFVLALCGSLTGSLIGFVFPACIFRKLVTEDYVHSRTAVWACCTFGAVIFAMSSKIFFHDLISSIAYSSPGFNASSIAGTA